MIMCLSACIFVRLLGYTFLFLIEKERERERERETERQRDRETEIATRMHERPARHVGVSELRIISETVAFN